MSFFLVLVVSRENFSDYLFLYGFQVVYPLLIRYLNPNCRAIPVLHLLYSQKKVPSLIIEEVNQSLFYSLRLTHNKFVLFLFPNLFEQLHLIVIDVHTEMIGKVDAELLLALLEMESTAKTY